MSLYDFNCQVCGVEFFAERRHAKTCSSRCRSILHSLKFALFYHEMRTGLLAIEMNQREIKFVNLFRRQARFEFFTQDMELIRGYKDQFGRIFVMVLKDKIRNFIEFRALPSLPDHAIFKRYPLPKRVIK